MSKARKAKIDLPDVKEFTRILRLMSNPTRMQLLLILSKQECGLNELCELLDIPHPSASHHLSLMKMSGLVLDRREGKKVYYTLNREMWDEIWKNFFGSGKTKGLMS
ncbi:MAG: metalloregulator ArsR/SmtB family transcription factor [Candidatus Methylomirabilis sp.]|nr:metalloregulator ArsR/SmtB family transcription factor [Deltaproteobacteria bacterium]